jgi:hypothetical protein
MPHTSVSTDDDDRDGGDTPGIETVVGPGFSVDNVVTAGGSVSTVSDVTG